MRPIQLRYSFKTLAGDASGGFIAALIALPYGLAMATLMGLPPVLGLFTSILTAPITALLGRNPVLIGGTASATVPFIAEAVRQQGIGGAAKVTLVAAVFMMIFSVLRLGRYVTAVPHAVISGFSCGIGAMMVITQLPYIFGLSKLPAVTSGPVLMQVLQVSGRLAEARWQPLLLACIVIAFSTLAVRLHSRVPGPLLGLGLAFGISQLLGLTEKEVGVISFSLPDFAGFAWSPVDVRSVLPAGFTLAFVASVNILITSRVVEHFRGRHRPLRRTDADSELGAYGIANICAGIFGAPVSVGIPARSLANVRCGGTTRVSNFFHALILLAVLGLGSSVLAHIPLAGLAGVTAWMGFCLLDWSTWRRLPKMRRLDATAFLVTALAVLLVNAVAAVFLGCAIYAADHLRRRFSKQVPNLSPAFIR